jgi:TolB-like protein
MKKAILILFFILNAHAYAQSTGKQSVVIYNFTNSGKQTDAHYSEILSENIGIEITRTGYYNVIRNRSTSVSSSRVSSPEYLRTLAQSSNADFAVTGIYNITEGSITVSSYIYVVESGEVYRVIIPREQIGVFVNNLIDTISVKISFELQKYIIRLSDPPIISPYNPNFKYYSTVAIKSEIPNSRIYYTLDGSAPSRTNGLLYSGPFNVYRTGTVNAVSVNQDGPTSNIASRKFEQEARISLLELNVMYGFLHYLSSPVEMGSLGTAQAVSVSPIIYFGGLDGVKTVPFVRDLGVGGWFDLGFAPLQANAAHTLTGYTGGLFYKLRFNNIFTAEIPVTFGQMTTSTLDGTNGTIFSNGGENTDTNLYGNSGMLFNLHFFFLELNLGVMYKYIMYDPSAAQVLSYQAGLGINF